LSVLDRSGRALGCAPGAVSVSLSCDDAARAALWGCVRCAAWRGSATLRSLPTQTWQGSDNEDVAKLDHEDVARG